jgi:hypothetical protein
LRSDYCAFSAESGQENGKFCDVRGDFEDIIIIAVLVDHILEGFAL